jgi:predicted chitinase/peptidoglycan hydrolase-like protein with peptidoglycan-binding domain
MVFDPLAGLPGSGASQNIQPTPGTVATEPQGSEVPRPSEPPKLPPATPSTANPQLFLEQPQQKEVGVWALKPLEDIRAEIENVKKKIEGLEKAPTADADKLTALKQEMAKLKQAEDQKLFQTIMKDEGRSKKKSDGASTLQKMANDLGFQVGMDGIYGGETTDFVKAMAGLYNLSSDGTKVTEDVAREVVFQWRLKKDLEEIKATWSAADKDDQKALGRKPGEWMQDPVLVRALQTTLQELGFLHDAVKPGVFDAPTEAALKAYALKKELGDDLAKVHPGVLVGELLGEFNLLQAKTYLRAASRDPKLCSFIFDPHKNPQGKQLLQLAVAEGTGHLKTLSPEVPSSMDPTKAKELLEALDKAAQPEEPPVALPLLAKAKDAGALDAKNEYFHRSSSTSPQLGEVQNALRRLGLFDAENGPYGPATTAAVLEFAKRYEVRNLDPSWKGEWIPPQVADALEREIARLDNRDQQAVSSVELLTKTLVKERPELLKRLIDESEEIRKITDPTEKAKAVAKMVSELETEINKLSPDARGAWKAFKAIYDGQESDAARVQLARSAYLTCVTALPGAIQYTDASTRSEVVKELDAKAKKVQDVGINEVLKGDVTAEQLHGIVPSLPLEKAKLYAPGLNAAMRELGLTTVRQKAAFIAQLAHESCGFRYLHEIGNYEYFERRYGCQTRLGQRLGNKLPGDGYKFRGGGWIQLTGGYNYARYGRKLFPNDPNILLKHPEMAAEPAIAYRLAAAYCRDVNFIGLLGSSGMAGFDKVTKAINGGYNGKADRDRYFLRASDVLSKTPFA